jgi:hypothetical protein
LILLQLDDWVLCRLYNKKNEWEKMQQQKEKAMELEASLSHSHSDTHAGVGDRRRDVPGAGIAAGV